MLVDKGQVTRKKREPGFVVGDCLVQLAGMAALETTKLRSHAQQEELVALRRMLRALEDQADQLLGLGPNGRQTVNGRPRKREYPILSRAKLAECRHQERSLEPLMDYLAVGLPATPRRPGRRPARLTA